MRTAIDTNILSALWSEESEHSRIAASLGDARSRGGLVICAPVFAELLAHPSANEDFVEKFLRDTGIAVDFDLDEDVWRQAGKSFAAYSQRRRRSGGDLPKRLMVDFLVASHALLRADRLMTLDARRYNQGFPNLRIV